MKRFSMLMLVCVNAYADPFVEVGIGAYVGASEYNCIWDYNSSETPSSGCSNNPLGTFAVGYEYKGFTIQAEHMSSLVEKDRGLNLLSVRYRHTFFK